LALTTAAGNGAAGTSFRLFAPKAFTEMSTHKKMINLRIVISGLSTIN